MIRDLIRNKEDGDVTELPLHLFTVNDSMILKRQLEERMLSLSRLSALSSCSVSADQ